MKLSILTITKRLGGLDVLEDALQRQTLWKSFSKADAEFIFVDEHKAYPGREAAFQGVCERLGIAGVHIYPDDYDPPRFGKLARASNAGLAAATGEDLFLLNDYIWIPDHAMERMCNLQRGFAFPALLSAISHKAQRPGPSDCKPRDQWAYSIFKESFPGSYGFPDVPLSWEDKRFAPEPYATRNAYSWEAHVAMAKTQNLKDLGGWDEDLDHGYAYDNVDLANRFLKAHPRGQVIVDCRVLTLSLWHAGFLPESEAMVGALRRNRKIVDKRTGIAALTMAKPATTQKAKGRVAFYIPDVGSWGDLATAKMMGGRELAVVRIAQELQGHAWNVSILCPGTGVSYDNAGVRYVPLMEDPETFLASQCDIAVAVEDTAVLTRFNGKRKIAWRQINNLEFKDLDSSVHTYVVNSPQKRRYFQDINSGVRPEKIEVIGNGVDLRPYDRLVSERALNRLVWSSSPDRGLHHILRWWPVLRDRFPELELHVCYKIDNVIKRRWSLLVDAEVARVVEQGEMLPGVTYLGPVSREQLVREQKEATLWVFCCDPMNMYETGSISGVEYMAAETPILSSDDVSMHELYGNYVHTLPLPVDDWVWIEKITELLNNVKERNRYVPAARKFAEKHTWAAAGKQWDQLLSTR